MGQLRASSRPTGLCAQEDKEPQTQIGGLSHPVSSAGVNGVFVRMNGKTKGVKAQHDMRGVHRLCRSSPCLPSSLFPSFGREGDGGMVLVDKAKNA